MQLDTSLGYLHILLFPVPLPVPLSCSQYVFKWALQLFSTWKKLIFYRHLGAALILARLTEIYHHIIQKEYIKLKTGRTYRDSKEVWLIPYPFCNSFQNIYDVWTCNCLSRLLPLSFGIVTFKELTRYLT